MASTSSSMSSVLTAKLSTMPTMEYLVLDANAIIHGFGLDFEKKAKHIVTIPEVIDEIKDEHARELLARLPYSIELREPSVESCRAVAQFALKSGDYNALSKPDIRLIALSHMLQQQQAKQTLESQGDSKDNEEDSSSSRAKGASHISPVALPSAEEMKKSNWSRALFADKLKASKVTSSSSAAATVEENEEVNANEREDAEVPVFAEDDFPALGSGNFNDEYFEDEYYEEQDIEIDLEALRELEEEQRFEEEEMNGNVEEEEGEDRGDEEEALQYNVVVEEDDQENNEVVDGDIDEETLRLREQEAEEREKEQEAHTHDEDCPCREVSEEEMKEFDAHATMVGNAAGASNSVAIEEEGKKKKKMRHKKLRKLQEQQSAEGETLPTEKGPSKKVAKSVLTSLPRRVPQSKDEADDDGVGWISSANMDKAERITRWKLPKSAFQSAEPAVEPSSQSATAPSQEGNEAIPQENCIVEEKEQPPVPKKTGPLPISWEGVSVVCCTSDYSMQNVLVQMGLRVISPTGQCIRAVRRYVMYCNACFRIHRKESDLTRMFCAYCGANHLSRVNCTVLENGEVQLHLKKNYLLSQKGTKYSLPAPGLQPRFQGELLLREDQLLSGIWKQRALRVKKEVASAFGEEVAGELGVHVNKGAKIVFGLGKKNNPNAMKGRERRGKRRTNNQVK